MIVACGVVVERESRRDVVEVHREQRRRQVDRDALLETLHRRRRAPDVHLEVGIEQRAEEAEPLQVIEVQVREHDVQLGDASPSIGTPSGRMPVPASSTMRCPLSRRTSTQDVLPP